MSSDRPAGFTSVMAQRLQTRAEDLDFFPTPPWAARAGGELISRLDPGGPWTCWEPACGEGHMMHGLKDYFGQVAGSDIHPYGAGAVFDFIGDAPINGDLPGGRWDWIVTNPPFRDGEAFVRAALPRARRGVAMLLRLVFLEGGGRWPLFYGDTPLAVCAPFAERVPMVKGRYDPSASSATAYAWFIWRKGRASMPPELMGIAPGAKARLTRPSDQRFARGEDAPLFGGGE
jgi:hypothetical protein